MNRRSMALTGLLASLLLSGCGEAVSDEQVIHDPVTIEHVDGADVARLTLTEGASERLGIETAALQASGDQIIAPAGALLVDPNGVFWVYTNPEPLVFIRNEIRVDDEDGDQAFLSAGPPAGTLVVTVGVAELYGAEYEIGH